MLSARCGLRLIPIGTQRLQLPLSHGVCAILGVGTGLGVGGVVRRTGGTFTVLATEGGHASFAPTNERSIELLRWLRRKYGRVSAERVLSGAGLANVYQALCEADGQHVPELSAAEITTRAANGSDGACVEAVGLFCELLGSFAGDLALTLGAWSGVLISGAMLQHFDRELLDRRVRSGFEYKGRFTPAMHSVPLETISHPHVELLGAARLLWRTDEKYDPEVRAVRRHRRSLAAHGVAVAVPPVPREARPANTHVRRLRAQPNPDDEFRKFVDGALRKHVPAEYLKEDAVADF